MSQSNLIETKLQEFLDLHPEIHTAILFGSSLTDSFRKDSDIDIAIACHSPLSAQDFMNYASLLTEKFSDRKIDLIDLHQAKGLILLEILTRGKILRRDTIFLAKSIISMHEYFDFIYPYVRQSRLNLVQDYLNG
ncbi:MAG: nucleotidyltransferase domain-containing protein [Leptospira sp.]|nr:nucleotidyltransferase domain-containing protein [Leptospira sp.]